MGYSCLRRAAWAMDAITDKCIAQTNSSNTFEANGESYFIERGREQNDGAMTGTVYRNLPNGYSRKSASFRIDDVGRVVRGPKFMRDCPLYILYLDGCEADRFALEPTKANLEFWMRKRYESFLPGGMNQRVPYTPVYSAEVQDIDGKVLVKCEDFKVLNGPSA